jgi:hypothetical protein
MLRHWTTTAIIEAPGSSAKGYDYRIHNRFAAINIAPMRRGSHNNNNSIIKNNEKLETHPSIHHAIIIAARNNVSVCRHEQRVGPNAGALHGGRHCQDAPHQLFESRSQRDGRCLPAGRFVVVAHDPGPERCSSSTVARNFHQGPKGPRFGCHRPTHAARDRKRRRKHSSFARSTVAGGNHCQERCCRLGTHFSHQAIHNLALLVHFGLCTAFDAHSIGLVHGRSHSRDASALLVCDQRLRREVDLLPVIIF